MDRKQPMELTNMCMVYKNGQVLVEEKIIRENENAIEAYRMGDYVKIDDLLL